jgi:hypothetical protein
MNDLDIILEGTTDIDSFPSLSLIGCSRSKNSTGNDDSGGEVSSSSSTSSSSRTRGQVNPTISCQNETSIHHHQQQQQPQKQQQYSPLTHPMVVVHMEDVGAISHRH